MRSRTTRRDFLRMMGAAAGVAVGATLPGIPPNASGATSPSPGALEKRLLGKTGYQVGTVGFGISSEIVALLPGSGSPPEEALALDGLPGRVSGSILYQKRAMLGYECLAPGFEAKFSTASFSGHYLFLPPAADGGAGRKARLARELPAYREVNPALSGAQIPSGNVWMTSEGGCVIAVAGKISRVQAEPLLLAFARRMRGICRAAP